MTSDFEATLVKTVQTYFRQNGVPKNLSDSIEYSLFLPGKRIRPRLAIASSELLGLSQPTAQATAMALEMIHCFTLIHDDLPCMDNDDFRRGKPSNHKVHGESTALLAGDALVPLAIEVFSEASRHVDSAFFLNGLKRLMTAVGPCGVIGGQAAESLITGTSTLEDLIAMHRRKTGALFEAAILIPMDFKGVSPHSNQGTVLTEFANELGIAFQIADDLEDAGQPGEKELTSILHFMSPSQAAHRAINSIEKTTEALDREFHDPSKKLISIAWEVLNRTRTYL